MEEYDELLSKPDDKGVLDMSHRAWRILEDSIWEWSEEIMILNLSFNEIKEIPPQIGVLALLQELNCASNEIEELPDEIGRCERLKILNVSGNKLDTLPDGIGGCKNLEVINARDNRIQLLPASLGKLSHLHTLSCPGNRLKSLPLELCSCVALDNLDVTSNDTLEMVPDQLKADTKMILWICRQFQLKEDKIVELVQANDDLEHMAKTADDERTGLKDTIVELRKENRKLKEEQPRHYMALKNGVKGGLSRVCTIM